MTLLCWQGCTTINFASFHYNSCRPWLLCLNFKYLIVFIDFCDGHCMFQFTYEKKKGSRPIDKQTTMETL